MKEFDIVDKFEKPSIENANKLEAIQASAWWIVQFKNQHNLVSRCISFQRTLPEFTPQKANEFTLQVHIMI